MANHQDKPAPGATAHSATPTQANSLRVCILTGGGDAPGLNAVLRAFVKTGTDLGLELLGSEDGFEGLINGDRLVKLKPSSVRGILPRGGSILGCSNRANPFAYPGRDAQGKETFTDVSERVLQNIADHGIDALVMVGGDGTMTHARELEKRGVRVVGVPKTIDNDLAATDVTFGFATAVGRYAGWISLYAGIAGGADVVLLPELPYDVDRIVNKIQTRAAAGATFSLVVVGEGARPKEGQLSTISAGAKGHLARLGGAPQQLSSLLQGRLNHEIRVTVLGHLQRGGSPSAFDRLLGTRFGVAAANLCARGEWGQMVALRGQDVVAVPISEAVDHPKLVPLDGELVRTARAVGIELGG